MENSKANEAAAEPPLDCRVMPLPLGAKTQWGTVEMVGFTGGERYYWMVNRVGSKSAGVAMIPALMVEAAHNTNYARTKGDTA